MALVRMALAPEAADWAADAVTAGGGTVVTVEEHPDALCWTQPDRWDEMASVLDRAGSVRWVQLPLAGVERVAARLDPDLTWTCAKGVYAEPVAEHVLSLTLAGLRRLPERARTQSWGSQGATTLYDAEITILGAGGITEALLGLLAPFRVRATVVRRNPSTPMPGAARIVGHDGLLDALPGAQVVVIALALTPETQHVIGAAQLAAMDENAWLINVGRGRHVDTDALVEALRSGSIGGAALDVTEPEPLPDGHPLWSEPRCLITPHTANPWQAAQRLLAARVTDNVQRYGDGRELLGLVDVRAGY